MTVTCYANALLHPINYTLKRPISNTIQSPWRPGHIIKHRKLPAQNGQLESYTIQYSRSKIMYLVVTVKNVVGLVSLQYKPHVRINQMTRTHHRLLGILGDKQFPHILQQRGITLLRIIRQRLPESPTHRPSRLSLSLALDEQSHTASVVSLDVWSSLHPEN
jgi:hypothetical protein